MSHGVTGKQDGGTGGVMKESFVHNQQGRVFKSALALLLAAMLALGSLSVPSLVWAEEADGQEQGEAAVEPEQAEAAALFPGGLTPLATSTDRWIKNYGGSKSDDLYSVVQTSDGGFVAVGSCFFDRS
jgi:hypothetical protein